MEDPTALATKITEAIQLLQAPNTSPELRRSANEFVLQAREHPSAVGAATQLCAPQAPPFVRFFAFQLLALAAESGRLRAQDMQVRSTLLDMFAKSTLAAGGDLQEVPAFVREKFAQALAAVAVYSSEWPEGWPDLQQQVFASGRTSRIHATVALTIFRNVSEVLQSDAASRLPVQRRKRLQAHLKELCGELFTFLAVAVTNLFPGTLELDRAAVLLVQELSGVVPVTLFLAADIDTFLRLKLGDTAVRTEVVQAFSEWLARDISKDWKEAPGRMLQLVTVVCELAGHCQPTATMGASEYELHKSVAMLVRDFVDSNKPTLDRHPELQAAVYRAALSLLRYPSICVQLEATSIVPHLLKAAVPDPKKNTKVSTFPAWLRLKEELLPPLLLCAFRRFPANFGLFPLPPSYAQALAATTELDSEEDLAGNQLAIRGRLRECMATLTPSCPATLAVLEFLHELLPRALDTTGGEGAFLIYEATLTFFECLVANLRVASGSQALEACRASLIVVLQAKVPTAAHETRRLEFLSRVGAALDACAEVAQGSDRQEVVLLFNHLFHVVEAGDSELRRKALTSCVAVSKAAPQAIRPMLQALVDKAAGLLSCIPDEQHSLCEALVAASTAAQNFEQQQALVQNLLGPLVAQWVPLVDAIADPGKLATGLLGDRAQLVTAHRLLQCFWACFRSSTVPTRPDVAAAGGFVPAPGASPGVAVRNPAGTIAAAVLPGLVKLFASFHAAFPSDGVRQPVGVGADVIQRLSTYINALDKEELKSLTSFFDTKRLEEADTWDAALPPPRGDDPVRVLQGRQLLYNLRLGLYRCLGAALGVQDGTVNHPERDSLLACAFDSLQGVHPYHVELQLRNIWLVVFSVSGMSSSTEELRTAFAAAALPKLLPSAANALNDCWRRLQLPDTQICNCAEGSALLWAMCTGTIMSSRTYIELVTSLVLHGGTTPAAASAGAAKEAPALEPQPMEKSGGKKKGKDRTGGAAKSQMTDVGAGATGGGACGSKTPAGWAGPVLSAGEALAVVQQGLCAVLGWQDPKALGHALTGLHALAVRLMSGGETHNQLKDAHIASPDAAKRSELALRAVVHPLIGLCKQLPPAPPGDGALHTVIGKPFFDFFAPERSQGQLSASPFAVGVTNALFPVLSGMCQVFVQVCRKHQVRPEVQQIVQFPALVEACQMLATLRHADEGAVHSLVTTLLDDGADGKMKRGTLRNLVSKAVDPDVALGGMAQ